MKILFIPIKQESQRVPNKNFRDFGGKELWKRTVEKFSDYTILIDTDSQQILEEAESYGHVRAYRRSHNLEGHEMSVNSLIKYCVNNYCHPSDILCQIHVTSPFLKPDTIQRAFNLMEMDDCDSICGGEYKKSRFWMQSFGNIPVPVNHNPLKLLQTQDLPIMIEENSSFYMFRVSSFKETGNRISSHHSFIDVPYPESLDIDTPVQFDWAVKLLDVLK